MCIYTLQLAAQEEKKNYTHLFCTRCHLFVSIRIDGLNV